MNGSSIIHQWVHQNLSQRCVNGEINRAEVVTFVSRLCSLKKKYVRVFLEEMKELEMIKPVNRFTLHVCEIRGGNPITKDL